MEGAKALGEVIAVNRTLWKLVLRGDYSLGEGVESLLAGLESSTTLQKLVLSSKYRQPADSRVTFLLV